jgi:glyoxylase-like metal-dependent hydrolase (beta-lactamase superfamily II)
LKLQMIGTGSAFAKSFYNNNALLTENGQTLLVDCGITAPMALHRLDFSISEIDAILITHIHGDHVGGLEEIAFQMKFLHHRKPILYVAETLVETLWEHTLKGGLQQSEQDSLKDFFDVRPLKPGISNELLPGIRAELIQTRHIPGKHSYSILFNDYLFYSGDAVFDPELLLDLFERREVEIALHDCQLHAPGEVHACLPELLTLPESIQRKVCLMHYGDAQPDFVGKTGHMTFIQQHRIYEFDRSNVREKFGLPANGKDV